MATSIEAVLVLSLYFPHALNATDWVIFWPTLKQSQSLFGPCPAFQGTQWSIPPFSTRFKPKGFPEPAFSKDGSLYTQSYILHVYRVSTVAWVLKQPEWAALLLSCLQGLQHIKNCMDYSMCTTFTFFKDHQPQDTKTVFRSWFQLAARMPRFAATLLICL